MSEGLRVSQVRKGRIPSLSWRVTAAGTVVKQKEKAHTAEWPEDNLGGGRGLQAHAGTLL